MQIIAHRRNTIEDLRQTPKAFGVELDIRSWGNELVVHHDPYIKGESLIAWLEHYDHQLLILNVKEEGLEARLLEIMRSKGIENFFFLDQSLPFLVKFATQNESRCAVRISEYESINTALAFKGLISWVWVDCFSQFPLNAIDTKKLISAGFKLCIVSPELHGRYPEKEIPNLRNLLLSHGIQPDAVCTKRPDLWLSI